MQRKQQQNQDSAADDDGNWYGIANIFYSWQVNKIAFVISKFLLI